MLDYAPVTLAFAQALLALVFLLGFWSKVRNQEAFEGVVYNYRLLPEAAVKPVAYGLPGVELMVGLGLLVAPVRPFAAMAAVALLAVFTAAIGINLARGRREIDCGCFSSVLKQHLSGWLLLRNGLLIALAFWLVTGLVPQGAITWLEWLTAGAAAVTVILLYLAAGLIATAARYNAARGSPKRG